MSDDPTAEADSRLEEALEREGARDPREFYRDRLKELKQANAEAICEAVAYYRDSLIPRVASGEVDPSRHGPSTGCQLAQWLAPGPVRSRWTLRGALIRAPAGASGPPASAPAGRTRADVRSWWGCRPKLSTAQRAAYDVLVEREAETQGLSGRERGGGAATPPRRCPPQSTGTPSTAGEPYSPPLTMVRMTTLTLGQAPTRAIGIPRTVDAYAGTGRFCEVDPGRCPLAAADFRQR